METTDTLDVVHMMSMARSGETMLVKLFNAHSQVLISHNLLASETPASDRLFGFLKEYPDRTIPRGHPLLSHLDVSGKQVLFLKQGVWEHRTPFSGFVLLRNPMAIYSSLKRYDRPRDEDHFRQLWAELMVPRFVRWSNDIDPGLAVQIKEARSPVEMFCLFHKRRFEALGRLENLAFRYEDICRDPRTRLTEICATMGLGFEEGMLAAHTAFPDSYIGHGTNDLSKAISTDSFDLWKSTLGQDEIDFISHALGDFMGRYYFDIL